MPGLKKNAAEALRALLNLDDTTAETALENLSAVDLAEVHSAAEKLTRLAAKVSTNKQLRQQLAAEGGEQS